MASQKKKKSKAPAKGVKATSTSTPTATCSSTTSAALDPASPLATGPFPTAVELESEVVIPPVVAPKAVDVSDEHPLSVGCSIIVKYRDGSPRLAKVIEHSCVNTSYSYYIHYEDFNRRMDEWVDSSRILTYPSEVAASSVSVAAGSNTAEAVLRPSTVAEQDHDEHEGMDAAALVEHEQVTKVKNVRSVSLGKHVMECWYFSPYPEELWANGVPVDCLYVCEFTFRYFRTKDELYRHLSRPNLPRHPPGNEIYRDSNVSMFEVDGVTERIYCQNLCYFAKLFLDHKTLYWDVDPFLFYVLCTYDQRGYHPVGFYSKEKYSDMGYNLACILAFPFAQRKSYGKFLIRFSYELSKKEEKLGSPEKPLSDLGAVSYRSYWASVLLQELSTCTEASLLSIADLCYSTSMLPEDVVPTLKALHILVEENDECAIYIPPGFMSALMERSKQKGITFDVSKLQWIPLYVVDPSIDKWSIQYFKSKAATTLDKQTAAVHAKLPLVKQEATRVAKPSTEEVDDGCDDMELDDSSEQE